MGYRTTVIFDNDHLDQLIDHNVGVKIRNAIMHFNVSHDSHVPNICNIVESAHADIAKLVVIGNKGMFSADTLSEIYCPSSGEDVTLTLLNNAAYALGYKLVEI